MKRFYQPALITLTAFVFCVTASELWADAKLDLLQDYPGIADKLNNGAQGREFWIAIPPNEAQGANVPIRALEIYVTSRFDTEVTMEVPGLGFGPFTKKVKANTITTFTDAPEGGNEMSWAYEVRTSESVTRKGIHLTAGKAISVYVLSAKRFTSEGYLALPVKVWGKEYMHMSYYDYPEPEIVRGGGFVIIAQDDDTRVSFKLNGSQSFGKTLGGKGIGQPYELTLQRGETYMVQGDGTDRNFDLSGTVVKADKAIGLISFHMRTIIPTSLGHSSRDNLIEMMPPISSWGREFITIEYKRVDRGDFFRLIASEDNTEFSVQYYDRNSKVLLGSRSGVLDRGQLREYEEVNPRPGNESIRGVAVWKANKPVLLMQYSYSTGWDGFQDFDPFMIIVPPVDQYILGATFQTPSRAEFNTNWFNIIALGDPNDPAFKKLKTLQVDGMAIWKLDPLFINNSIPGTDYHWARIAVAPGAHTISGATPFGSAIYGFSRFESYGWPAGVAIDKIDEPDTMPPTIVIEEEDETQGEFVIITREVNSNGQDQIDQGISAVELLEAHSNNFTLHLDQDIPAGEYVASLTLRLSVADLSSDGLAALLVRDRAGNVAIESFSYSAKYVSVPESPVQFGAVRVGKNRAVSVTIHNPTKAALEITSLAFAKGEVFSIDESLSLPFTVPAGEQRDVEVHYQPIRESGTVGMEADTDEMRIEVEGRQVNSVTITGTGIQPHIRVSDFTFPVVRAGEHVCDNRALRVVNNGTDALTITMIEGIAEPFTFDDEVLLPVIIPAGEERLLGSVCFQSPDAGEFSTTISFISDAPADDPSTAILSGQASSPTSVALGQTGLIKLHQNSPNPISGTGLIEFELQKSMPVTLRLFNSLGGSVMTLADGWREAGMNRVAFDVSALPGGLYYYTLKAGEERVTLGLAVVR